MRFATVDSRMLLVHEGRGLDLAEASTGRLPADPVEALGRWAEVHEWAASADWSAARPVDPAAYGAPVAHPRQVFAVALNYRPHAAEAGYQPPDAPLVFTKFPTSITGPVAQVRLPPGNVDWEVEPVAVIGAGGRDIPPGRGWDAVAGLTLGQDLSERVLQAAGHPPQFSLGKSYAGFGPIGPLLATPEEFADRDDIAFDCRLGDEVLQSGRTSSMIFGMDELVCRLSAVCELLPGDLVFTGTPEGVGNRRTPPRFLKAGETLVSRMDVVGEISQHFTA